MGANLGDVSQYLIDSGMYVYAFEPNPNCFKILQKRFKDCPHIKLIAKGAGYKADKIPFYHTHAELGGNLKASEAGSFIPRDVHNLDNSHKRNIDVLDIFAFIDNLPSKPFLTKIDIEGSEFDILRRLILEKKFYDFGHLFIETHARFSPEYQTRLIEYKSHLKTL